MTSNEPEVPMWYPQGQQQPESYPPPPPGESAYGYGDERRAPKRPGTLLAAPDPELGCDP
ncbi:MAG: hypothetical protein H0U28_07540 [Nocardioidaceae bacterium]|nr:hypothetical protein [Nocardioidaceae bacterium]